jgi:hypothetical protein
MKYAQIQNNEIIKIHNVLPESWNNISNLNGLSANELSDLSWSGNIGYKFYPVIEQEVQSVDRRFYTIEEPNYEIDNVEKLVNESYSISPKSLDQSWAAVRQDRNFRLSKSDWTQLPDSPLNEQQKNLAAAYRQQLRDITEQSDPFNIVWPETIINP